MRSEARHAWWLLGSASRMFRVGGILFIPDTSQFSHPKPHYNVVNPKTNKLDAIFFSSQHCKPQAGMLNDWLYLTGLAGIAVQNHAPAEHIGYGYGTFSMSSHLSQNPPSALVDVHIGSFRWCTQKSVCLKATQELQNLMINIFPACYNPLSNTANTIILVYMGFH